MISMIAVLELARVEALKMKAAMSELGLMQLVRTLVSMPPAPVAAIFARALFQSGRL